MPVPPSSTRKPSVACSSNRPRSSLHARAATLIFAASFASSLLGAQALEDGVGAWDWIALGLLVAIGSLAVFLLWPYYNLTFVSIPRICSPATSTWPSPCPWL
jgi:hypothetical protein